jgi:hypothetical protein
MFHAWSALRCWLYLRYLVATGRSSVAVPHHAAPQLRLIVQDSYYYYWLHDQFEVEADLELQAVSAYGTSVSRMPSNKHEAPSIAVYITFHRVVTSYHGRNTVSMNSFKFRYAFLSKQERFPRTKTLQALKQSLVICPALHNIPIPVTLRRSFHHNNTPVRDYHIRKLSLQLTVFKR